MTNDELREQLKSSLARNSDLEGMIATLDQENRQIRARMERLEKILRVHGEVVFDFTVRSWQD